MIRRLIRGSFTKVLGRWPWTDLGERWSSRLVATAAVQRCGVKNAAYFIGTFSLNSMGMKSRISRAGTKYLAISLPSIVVNFALMIPSKHLRLGSNTPDPEFPVLATSAIKV